jgi:hypothetical protein
VSYRLSKKDYETEQEARGPTRGCTDIYIYIYMRGGLMMNKHVAKLRRLGAGFSPWSLGFNLVTIHRYNMEEVA